MSDFDAAAYFDKINAIKSAPLDTDALSPKEQQVFAATQRNVARLEEIQRIKKSNEVNSLAGKLGLDPEGTIGSTVNFAAASANDVVKAAANAPQLPLIAIRDANRVDMSDEAQMAYGAYKAGQATEEDMKVLNGYGGLLGTNLEKLERAAKAESLARTIEEKGNINSLTKQDVDTGEYQTGLPGRLVGDTVIGLAKGVVAVPEMVVGLSDMVSGGESGKRLEEEGVKFKEAKQILNQFLSPEQQAADAEVINAEGFMETLSEIADNPSTVKQFLAESFPSMLAGGVISQGLIKGGSAALGAINASKTLAQTNAAISAAAGVTAQGVAAPLVIGSNAARTAGTIAATGAGEGIVMAGAAAEGTRQQTEDGLLTDEQIMHAASMAPFGAVVGILGARLGKRLGVQDVDVSIAQGARAKNRPGVVGSTTITGGIEGLEELVQSTGEKISENVSLGKEWDDGVGNAAAIGLATGFAMGAPAGLAQAGETAEREAKAAEQVAQFESAADTGDVSTFTDPKDVKKYAPEKAISALMKRSLKEDLSPTEKEETLVQAADILSKAKAELESVTANYQASSPEAVATLKTALDKIEARIANPVEADVPKMDALLERQGQLKEAITEAETVLADPVTAKDQEIRKTRIAKLEKQIAEAQGIYDNFSNGQSTETIEADADATPDAAVEGSVEKGRTAASKVINLAMSRTEGLDPEKARAYAGNANNSYTPEERELLVAHAENQEVRREFLNSAGVTQEILHGDKKRKQKGIADYKAAVVSAISTQNAKASQLALDALAKFGAAHSSKNVAAQAAFAIATKEKNDQYIVLTKGKGWAHTRTRPTAAQFGEKQAYVVHRNSGPKLVSPINAELNYLRSAYKELAALHKVSFGAPKVANEAAPAAVQEEAPAPAVTERPAKVAKPVVEAAPAPAPKVGVPPTPTVAPTKDVQRVAADHKGKTVPAKEAGLPKVGQVWIDSNGVKRHVISRTKTKVVFELRDVEGNRIKDNTVSLKALKESKWGLLSDSTIPNADPDDVAALKEMLEHPRWTEKGGLLLRDLMGKAVGRTTWVATYDGLAAVLANTGVTNAKAIELITRAEEGHPPLTERQQAIVGGLLEALNEMTEGPQFAALGQPEAVVEEASPVAEEGQATPAQDKVESQTEPQSVSAVEPVEVNVEGTVDEVISFDPVAEVAPIGSLVSSSETVEDEAEIFVNAGEGILTQNEDGEAQIDGSLNDASGSASPGMLSIFTGEPVTEIVIPEDTPADKRGEVYSLAYRAVNLVKYAFTQKAVKTPLLLVKDFLSTWSNNSDTIRAFLKDPLTGTQEELLEGFRKRAVKWQPIIQSLWTPNQIGTPGQYSSFANYGAFFVEGISPKDIEENLTTAISFAGMSWVADEAAGQLYNDEDAIRALLFLKDTDSVKSAAKARLSTIGNRQPLVVRSLGQRAVLALGMSLKKDMSAHHMGQLENALGTIALGLLLKEGLAESDSVPNAELAQWMTNKKNIEASTNNKYAESYFIRVGQVSQKLEGTVGKNKRPRTKQVLNEKVQEIRDLTKQTGGILNKLFSVQLTNHGTVTRKPKAKGDKRKVKGSKQNAPTELQETLDTVEQQSAKARGDMLSIIDNFSTDVVLAMGGSVDLDNRFVHIDDEMSLRAKNEGLERELTTIKEFVAAIRDKGRDAAKTSLYFLRSIWKQQRVGYLGDINMQTGKIMRHVFALDAWKVTVPFADRIEEKQLTAKQLKDPEYVQRAADLKAQKVGIAEAMMTSFKLGVAESLDIKTENMLPEDAILKMEAKLEGDVFQTALAHLHAMLIGDEDGKINPDYAAQLEIAAAVAEGEGNFHTLDGLVAWTYYQAAKNSPDATGFTVQLMREVDGKTNGPALTLMQLGAAMNAEELLSGFLNKAGFYSDADKVSGFTEWWAEPNKPKTDLYQSLAAKIVEGLDPKSPLTQAIYAFTGQLKDDKGVTGAGRNLAKPVITEMTFGAFVDNIIGGMANKFVEDITSNLAKIANGESKLSMYDALNHLNEMLEKNPPKFGEVSYFPLDMPVDEVMQLRLKPAQIEAFRQAFISTVGGNVKQAVEDQYAVLLQRRAAFANGAGLAYSLYEVAHNSAVRQLKNELMDKGELAFIIKKEKDSKGVTREVRYPIEDLKPSQLEAIDEKLGAIVPRMHSSMSKADGDTRFGLLMAKVERKLTGDPAYQSKVKLGSAIPTNGQREANSTSSAVSAMQKVLASPSVGSLVLAIHSTDSAIASRAYRELSALNVHDALGLSIAELLEGARLLNKETYNAMANYSVPAEMYVGVAASIQGFIDNAGSIGVTMRDLEPLKELIEKTAKRFKKENDYELPGSALSYILKQFNAEVMAGERVRLDTASKITVVDQYPAMGGSYKPTKEERAAAALQRDALNESPINGVAPSLIAGLETLEERLLKGKAAQTSTPKDLVPAADEDVEAPEVPSASSIIDMPAMAALPEIDKALAYFDSLGEKIADMDFSDTLTTLKGLMLSGMAKTLGQAMAIAQLAEGTRAHIHQYLAANWNPTRSAWGEVGKPVLPYSAALANAFSGDNAPKTARELLDRLTQHLSHKADKSNLGPDKFNKMLVHQLKGALAKNDVKVVYITKDTPFDTGTGRGASTAYGFYSFKPREDGVLYIKSPDFVHSNLTPELLLHELTHVVLSGLIDQGVAELKADPKSKSPLAKSIHELESLLASATKMVNSHPGLQSKYKNAVENIHELVSWGMTNQGFQKEILDQIQVETGRGKSLSTSGMRKLIDALVQLIFPTYVSDAEIVSGMAILVANTTNLLHQATEATAEMRSHTESKNLFMRAPENQANKMTLNELFTALANPQKVLSGSFVTGLQDIMSSIVAKLHGPYGASFNEAMQGQTFTAEEIWLNTLATGKAPYAASALQGGIPMSEQEALMVEEIQVVMQSALAHPEAAMSFAVKDIKRMRAEAKARLSADGRDFFKGDWATATDIQKEEAKKIYDFIFSVESGNGGASAYLSKFVALGLAYEPLNTLLDVRSAPALELKDKSLLQKMSELFNYVLDMFYRFGSRTNVKNTDKAALKDLLTHLANIEAKRRARIAANDAGATSSLGSQVGEFAEKFKTKLTEVGDNPYLRKSPKALLRGIGIAANIIGNDRQEAMMEAIGKIRDYTISGQHGILASLFNEAIGETDSNMTAHELFRAAQRNEQVRKEIRTQMADFALNNFKDGKDFTTEQKAAITKVMLRSGMSHLLEDFSANQIEQIVSNDTVRAAEIAKLTKALMATGAAKHYSLKAVKQLAWFRVSSRVRGMNLMQNTENIAAQFGTENTGNMTAEQIADLVKILNPLTALYAVEYSSKVERSLVSEIMRTENNREEQNGALLTLHLHKDLQKEARERNFKNEEALQMYGYTPEIYNPHVDVVVAGLDQHDLLVAQGYTQLTRPVILDKTAVQQETEFLYVRKFGGLRQQLTGIISYTGKNTKGSTEHFGITNVNHSERNAYNERENKIIASRRKQEIKKMYLPDASYDPRRDSTTRMAPVVNPDGEIVNYRYMMTDEDKNEILERNNDFNEIMGIMAGSIFDKEKSSELNRRAVQAMKDQYDAEYASSPKAFLSVSRSSSDPALREIYTKLPKDTQKAINEIWGTDGMMIRTDLMDITFGYRKSSITHFLQTDAKHRTVMEALAADVLSLLMGVREQDGDAERLVKGEKLLRDEIASRRLGIVEDIWQQAVAHTKDIIVVKTGAVMMANISSNVLQLLWYGISPTEIIKNHRIALKGVLEYRKDRDELFRLEKIKSTGYVGQSADLDERIAILKDSLKRNPVRSLVEAGLMPTIVEDVAYEDDTYSYKSFVATKLQGITDRIPEGAKTLGKAAYMAHGTKLYDILSQATQISDFVARYTLYQHETTKADEPLSSAMAIRKASSAFVNYDLPTHRTVQWMNDAGLFMFTKYYIRIQRVLFSLYREQPARALAMLAFNSFFDVATPVDSSFWAHLGNPLHEGAFSYFGAVDDMMTVKLAMSPF